jgi:hypothetical protein
MEYLKIDPRLDEHPDVLDAGFIGATVFQVILRTCASFDKRGRLPKKFSPAWLARRLNIGDDETSLPPETFVRIGIERCVSAGLLERDGEDLIIPGWERFYTENVPGAERTRSWRQRQRDARDAGTSRGDEQRLSDATPPTYSTHPQDKVSEAPPPKPTPVPAPVTDEPGRKFYAWAQETRTQKLRVMPQGPLPSVLPWYARALEAVKGDEAKLRAAWLGYLDDGWPKSLTPVCPWETFLKADRWTGYVKAASSRPRTMRPMKPGESEADYEKALAAFKADEGGAAHG